MNREDFMYQVLEVVVFAAALAASLMFFTVAGVAGAFGGAL